MHFVNGRLFIILIILLNFVSSNDGKFNQKYGESSRRYPYEEEESYKHPEAPKSKSQKGAGISAWGLIILIISLILLSVGAYYIAIFYPLLCKKERKYDRIELANV